MIPYRDDADALRIADDSDYGLSGSVWTADVARGLEVARACELGPSGSTSRTAWTRWRRLVG